MEKKILFVDDEPLILRVLESVFKADGYTAFSTTSGVEGLELVAREDIRVCFVDLRMPVMDGLELCRRIKAIQPDAHVFALSAYISGFKESEFRDAGFDCWLLKPFNIDQLLAVGRNAIDQLQKEEAAKLPS
ncbi:MAG: response regulator [bacterium]